MEKDAIKKGTYAGRTTPAGHADSKRKKTTGLKAAQNSQVFQCPNNITQNRIEHITSSRWHKPNICMRPTTVHEASEPSNRSTKAWRQVVWRQETGETIHWIPSSTSFHESKEWWLSEEGLYAMHWFICHIKPQMWSKRHKNIAESDCNARNLLQMRASDFSRLPNDGFWTNFIFLFQAPTMINNYQVQRGRATETSWPRRKVTVKP